MIEGFDKEIDALLRRTAKSETAFADINPQSKIQNPKSTTHLDADEISVFAENALPERLKQNYTAHFADCDRCRTILSNLITLNSETETVSPRAAPKVAAVSIPWHRKFFAFPRLAYALGALVVLFGGFFALLVVRNANEATGSADVSQTHETQPRASGPSFETETVIPAPIEISNTAMAGNMASNTMMSNSASTATTNSTTSVSANSAARSSNANASAAQSNSTLKEAQPTEVKREAVQNAAGKQAEAQATDAAGNPAPPQNETERITADGRRTDKKTSIAQDASRADSLPLSARNTTPTVENDDSPKAKMQKPKPSGAESRQIGGKNFTRKEGVWYDANYNGQTTTNVSRGSGDYQKLDAGLRSITGNLSGTVVIVWKNKAYRIQ